MNPEFWMFSAANTRDICAFGSDAAQVDDDAEAAGLLQEGADGQPVHGGLAAAGEVQIKQERGHAERTQRHQADFHRACRQLFAQQ
ncbi:hypothetical protein G6F63_015787 [Rhizopus arrhizus]|nr:hypothetical protein G6F63_015787 [Rhizopus arrhizus]